MKLLTLALLLLLALVELAQAGDRKRHESMQLIPTGERSGLQTRIAATDAVRLLAEEV
jgi:hypothetical protein